MRTSARLFAACMLLLSCVSAAMAERRVALVIGNSGYVTGGRLANAGNDAGLVAAALKAAHFSTVEARTDLGVSEFRQALRAFQSESDGAAVSLIYFAGHGIEVSGTNWILPIDVELKSHRDLDYEAIPIN